MFVNNSKNILKARCDDLGLVLKLIFWGYAIYLAVMLGLGVWLLFQPESAFSINLLDTGNGMAGYGFYNGNLEVDFVRNALNSGVVEHPKLVYMAGYLGGCVEKVIILAILWNVAGIFRKITKGDSPFMERSCKAVFRVGVLTIVSGFIKSGFTATVLGIARYGGGGLGNSAYWWQRLLIGGILICLSYIFEYGASLQMESDETL